VLAVQECANDVVSSELCQVAMQSNAFRRQIYVAANVTANYVCREHVEGNYCKLDGAVMLLSLIVVAVQLYLSFCGYCYS